MIKYFKKDHVIFKLDIEENRQMISFDFNIIQWNNEWVIESYFKVICLF